MLRNVFGIIVNSRTLDSNLVAAVNSVDAQKFASEIVKIRLAFYQSRAASHPSQQQFLKGWTRRMNDFGSRIRTTITNATTKQKAGAGIALLLIAAAAGLAWYFFKHKSAGAAPVTEGAL